MSEHYTRREFLSKSLGAAASASLISALPAFAEKPQRKPNIVFVFADQMRYDELGCSGNQQIRTPNMDKLASQGVLFTNAISGNPVCAPYRAMMLTGRYGQSNGVFRNENRLPAAEKTMAEMLKQHGYETGYIGKWHLDGQRNPMVPKERRHGFDYWVSENCQHQYFDAPTWTSDGEKQITLSGYQPDAQTDIAIRYINEHKDKPFYLCMSWGPPHVPNVAPEKYLTMYKPEDIKQRPNVEGDYRDTIAKCYGQVTSIDDCLGRLMKALDEHGLRDNTIVVFTSDHGDMLMSHGQLQKQRPWEEAIHIPFIMRYPDRMKGGRKSDVMLHPVDIVPTLLSLAGVSIPAAVEGTDLAPVVLGRKGAKEPDSVLLQDIIPAGQARETGIREWRGVRTKRYTYARNIDRGWVLYDNQKDPYQLNNLIDKPEAKKLQDEMDAKLQDWLKKTHDDFAPAAVWETRVPERTR